MPNTSDPGGPFLGTIASVSKSEAARQRQKRMREMDSDRRRSKISMLTPLLPFGAVFGLSDSAPHTSSGDLLS